MKVPLPGDDFVWIGNHYPDEAFATIECGSIKARIGFAALSMLQVHVNPRLSMETVRIVCDFNELLGKLQDETCRVSTENLWKPAKVSIEHE